MMKSTPFSVAAFMDTNQIQNEITLTKRSLMWLRTLLNEQKWWNWKSLSRNWNPLFAQIKLNHVQKFCPCAHMHSKPAFAKFKLDLTACWQQNWPHLCLWSCSCSCTNTLLQKTHALSHPGSCTWDDTCSNNCAQTTKKPLWIEVKPVPNCEVLCGHQILGWRLCACPQSKIPDALVCTSTMSWIQDAT